MTIRFNKKARQTAAGIQIYLMLISVIAFAFIVNASFVEGIKIEDASETYLDDLVTDDSSLLKLESEVTYIGSEPVHPTIQPKPVPFSFVV